MGIKPLYIIKIGGSCLTYKKEGIQKIRRNFLKKVSGEVNKSLTENNFSLIIVHGGGSITHPLLDRYQVAQKCKTGSISTKEDKLSTAQIHLAMSNLNKRVTKAFLDQGIPVWPFQTSALITSSCRNIKNTFLKSITLALEKGYIPILHGDFILDNQNTICICSGDLVACMLAQKLHARKLFFASDVDGIYQNSSRAHKNNTPLTLLTSTNFTVEGFNSSPSDHSGGMIAKVNYIKEYCKEIEVVIFNGLTKNNFEKVLLGGGVGTSIKI